jgi:hypothetical protein
MSPTLLRDKQARDVALHTRGGQYGAWLGEALDPGRDVWSVAENLACAIHDDRPSFEADTSLEDWLAGIAVLAIELAQGAVYRQCSSDGTFGIIFMCDRIAEER